MQLKESNPYDLKLRQLVHADEHNIFGRIANIVEEDGVIKVSIDWRIGLQTTLPISEYDKVSLPEETDPNPPTLYGWH